MWVGGGERGGCGGGGGECGPEGASEVRAVVVIVSAVSGDECGGEVR